MTYSLKSSRFRVNEEGTVSESQITKALIGHKILVLDESMTTLSEEE